MSNPLELKAYNAKKEAEDAAKALESFVNPYGCCHDSFVKQITHRAHRTLQQSIGKLVFALIKGWAEMFDSGQYDLRNEHTCKVCKEIVSKLDAGWDNPPTV